MKAMSLNKETKELVDGEKAIKIEDLKDNHNIFYRKAKKLIPDSKLKKNRVKEIIKENVNKDTKDILREA